MTLFRPLSNTVRDAVAWARSPKPRVPLGFSMFDTRTSGGARLGEVVLFQARSSVGKTTFFNNVLVNNQGRPSVFFSLEMHGRYVALALAAIYTSTPSDQIEYDLQTTGRSEALQKLVDDFPTLAIVDKPAMTLKEMAHAIAEAEDAWGEKVQLVGMDYMELIGGVPSISGAAESVDKVARKVKDWTREQDTVTVLLHQVGRGSGEAGHVPLDITAGRFGGETQADYVLGAYRPCLAPGISQEEYLELRWQFHLQFLKTRGGSEIHPAGVLHQFNPFTRRISETWEQDPLPLFEPQPTPVEIDDPNYLMEE